MSSKVWVVIAQKIEKRRIEGKKSSVYIDGKEVDSKKVTKRITQHATNSDIMKVTWQSKHQIVMMVKRPLRKQCHCLKLPRASLLGRLPQ